MQERPALRRPNGHQTRRITEVADATCPTCSSPISVKKLREIEGNLRTRDDEIERAAEARFAAREPAIRKEAAAAASAALMDRIAKAEQAKKAAEGQVRQLKADQEKAIQARIEAEREAAAKKTAEAVTAEKVKHFEEKTKLTEQLAEMQRRLEKKTAHELGEPAEVDLFAALEAAFPDDRISRVRKGAKGPDVIMEVVQGEVIGSIALDSKNHARWSNGFTQKLRADQLASGSDWAILSSATMPAGARQLHIQDGVIVADPARVVVLVHLLRRHMIENHRLRLSAEARDVKAEKLLAYITSQTCTDLIDRIVKVSADLRTMDVNESRAHSAVWKKRGDLIGILQTIHREFTDKISAIIAGEPV